MPCDAHNYRHRLELVLKTIDKDSVISDGNKKLLMSFKENCIIEKISLGRIVRYMYDLRTLAKMLGKDYEAANKDDIKALIGRLEQETHFIKRYNKRVFYQESTKRDFRITLRKFYKWLRETEDYPEEVKWIKTHNKKCDKIRLPEEMLSEEDIEKLINHADNPRDRAFIAILYESGCRIGEMLFLRLKHINFDQYGAQLLVDGKTGYRRIRIIGSAPYLSEWINKHPLKNDPEAALWISRNCENLGYAALRISLMRTAKRAGISKKMNFHNFRHSRATYLANHLTEAQMKEHFGWVQSSDMASVYVHLSGRDVDAALLKVYGIKTEIKKEESRLNPKNCPRCKEINPFTNVFCFKCGMILDEQLRNEKIQKDMERSNADRMIDIILSDEDFKDRFIKKLSGVNNL
jgi:integrase/recombinase XerD